MVLSRCGTIGATRGGAIVVKPESVSLPVSELIGLGFRVEPGSVFCHPLFHFSLPATAVAHDVSMGFTIVRLQCHHPFFECFPIGGCVT